MQPSTRLHAVEPRSHRPAGPSRQRARLAHAEPVAALQLQVRADVRGQRPDDPLELCRGPRGQQVPLVGGDLLRVGGVVVVLLGELELARREAVERPDQQLATDLRELRREAS